MKMAKKYVTIVFAAVMTLFRLPVCDGGNAAEASAAQEDKLQIIATIFPEYDWVKEILGAGADNAEITMLIDSGVDPHSYQMTVEDVLKISNCDMFIYVGGESDQWAEDALKETRNKDMVVISLLDALGDAAKTEHEHTDEHEYDGHEYDEHVWLSLKNAETLCTAIADGLSELDPDREEMYNSNLDAYKEKLADLDNRYRSVADNAEQKTLLFGDRFPFCYLMDDYGISCYAAFSGCSAEAEASFETITSLAGKVDELGLSAIITIEKSDHKIAETIIQNTQAKNQKILTLDSMQSTTLENALSGTTYLSVMESNLKVLEEALR